MKRFAMLTFLLFAAGCTAFVQPPKPNDRVDSGEGKKWDCVEKDSSYDGRTYRCVRETQRENPPKNSYQTYHSSRRGARFGWQGGYGHSPYTQGRYNRQMYGLRYHR